MKYLLPLLLLASCQSDLGLVVKGHVEGQGVVASDGKRTLIFAKGSAIAGIYQVASDGELALVRQAAAHDAVRVIDRDTDMDVTVKIGEPLPAWCEPIVRSLLPDDQIALLEITFLKV